METRYTPGPWKYREFLDKDDCVRISITGVSAFSIAKTCYPADEAERANARLIAAAPDLIGVLQEVLKRIEDSDEWWMDCPDCGGFDADAIRAAIAKANGITK